MTIAQQIEEIGIQKGIQQGKAEGRQEGIQEGRQKGKLEGEKGATFKLAKQFLANGADRDMVKLSTGLSDEELDRLND